MTALKSAAPTAYPIQVLPYRKKLEQEAASRTQVIASRPAVLAVVHLTVMSA
jgi:hypothetical protein